MSRTIPRAMRLDAPGQSSSRYRFTSPYDGRSPTACRSCRSQTTFVSSSGLMGMLDVDRALEPIEGVVPEFRRLGPVIVCPHRGRLPTLRLQKAPVTTPLAPFVR